MELLELKATWQLFDHEVIQKDFVNEKTVNQSIRQKSKTEVNHIKKGMYYKFAMGGTASSVGFVMIMLTLSDISFNPLEKFFNPTESLVFFAMLTLSLWIMLFFNLKAFRQIQKLEKAPENLKKGLEGIVSSMRSAMTFNIYSEALLSPIFMTWLYYAFAFKNHDLAYDIRTLILLLLPIASGVFGYCFQRYMQGLKFGQYVQKLEAYLKEFKENS
ncbi:hypothetical protein [Roseivirga sp.]|uniref:hypothetical protein n=1 Tax=Roseivirga sp. TaxID=1964215 RepID=UPI003B5294A4